MRALRNMEFLYETTTKFNYWLNAIDEAETYEAAKNQGHKALGFLDCMITYLNCMVCFENNDFTGELGEQLDRMEASVYDHMGQKAIETNQDTGVIFRLLNKRDEIARG